MVSFHSINQLMSQRPGSIRRLDSNQSICWSTESMGYTGGKSLLNQSVGQSKLWVI